MAAPSSLKGLLFLSLLAFCFGKTANEWKSRVVYQIITDRFGRDDGSASGCGDMWHYCGGTWRGIMNHLDYISALGVNAIWISPIPLNIEGAYHGYAAKDLAQLNPHFGSSDDLKNLINACHKKDIWVMADVVANHMGNPGNEDFSQLHPFNNETYYHRRCQINNYQNQTEVEFCRLADLPDLDQDNTYVRSQLYQWVRSTVATYGFDGIRIDTIPEVNKAFWPGFAQAAGVFQLGEVFDGRVDYVAGYQAVIDATLSYPMYFTLRDVFQRQASVRRIADTLSAYDRYFKDQTVLGTFLDNHDNPRFLQGQSDYTLYQNGLAYVLMTEGVPLLYYGTEQGFSGGADPGCREPLWPTRYAQSNPLFKFLQTVLQFRTSVALWNQGPQVERYIDDNFLAFTRGDVLTLVTNVGSNGPTVQRTLTYLPASYKDGTKLCNIFWPNDDCITVTGGKLDVALLRGETKIFYPKRA
ncbi:putative Alpha-amylase A type-3 [Paratrimastix pyriformis]|uniref:alpha-amylase n=1 Tax=Paratrimastix pyriformis TaxID=342808 RepID=A0ABQ8U9J2_9EUKA|nr:putative Alpha-amylase A type-3 [Paratrimastix pyriformis]